MPNQSTPNTDKHATPAILFTAFEPSGDEHAAPVIAQLRELLPDVPIIAMGGKNMEQAGAQILEYTTDNAAMGLGALAKINEHRARLKRLKIIIDNRPIALHVPTDSPAANWAICKMVKRKWNKVDDERFGKLGRVIHLVAPQVWAWASWRVRRLQKWSDHVLCLLPFEPDWFAAHKVDATFIGHPVFDKPLEFEKLTDLAEQYPKAKHNVAILPGSRPGEIIRNWPVMRNVINSTAQHLDQSNLTPQDIQFVIAAASEKAVQLIKQSADVPPDIPIVLNETDAVLHWADTVLVVSGTATLHVARQHKPMVVVYKSAKAGWYLLFKWLMQTDTFTLPNLIAAHGPTYDRKMHIVPEFVPHLSDSNEKISQALGKVISHKHTRNQQVAALRQITNMLEGHDAGTNAAQTILKVLGLG